MQSISPKRYQHLQPEERVTLASLVHQKFSVRAISRVLSRSPSTISRELSRNGSPGGYGSAAARACVEQRRRQSSPPHKLHHDGLQFDVFRHFLDLRWSPEQIALTLATVYPKGHEHRVSRETIYNCIYAQPVGELKRELIATLRHAHNERVSRSKGQDRRGQIPDMLSIHIPRLRSKTGSFHAALITHPLKPRCCTSGLNPPIPKRISEKSNAYPVISPLKKLARDWPKQCLGTSSF